MQNMVRIIRKSQMKIQQMAFMIVAVFIFFVLVGLFLLQVFLSEMRQTSIEREREQVLNILNFFSQLPEFSCSEGSAFCIDEDKLFAMKIKEINEAYSAFWPISSIKVYKVGNLSSLVECPAKGCNYYNVFEEKNVLQKLEYSSYVVICKKMVDSLGYDYDQCNLGKLSLGVKLKS